MLAERLRAKMSRKFDVADRVQTNLIENGVFVHDASKEWRADGVPYGSFDRNNNNDGGGGGRGGGFKNQTYSKSSYSIDVVGVEDRMIDALVNERLKHKMGRNYDKADSIREGLRTKFNVLVDDR